MSRTSSIRPGMRTGLQSLGQAANVTVSFKSSTVLAAMVATMMVASGDAFAQSNLQPVQSMLQTLISVLTGPIASMVAILAVIGCGFLAWTGRLTWGIAGSVIFGIVLVFGAPQIVAFFQRALGQ